MEHAKVHIKVKRKLHQSSEKFLLPAPSFRHTALAFAMIK